MSLSKIQERLAERAPLIQTRFHQRYGGQWANSPYSWMHRLPPLHKHSAVKDLFVATLREELGYAIETMTLDGMGSFLRLHGWSGLFKASLSWDNGSYLFNHLRLGPHAHILLFGLSPTMAHLWTVPARCAGLFMHEQPMKKKTLRTPKQEYALVVNPLEVPSWLTAYGGPLEEGLIMLDRLLSAVPPEVLPRAHLR